LKEGTQSDPENKDALFRLLRYNANFTDKASEVVSLDDYVARMVPGQNKIYFAYGTSYEAAMKSPFYEPFKGKDVPVLIVTN
jgi:molecular chaperone HtpG